MIVVFRPQMKDTGLTATLPVARVREDYLQSFRELQESPRPHELEQVRDTVSNEVHGGFSSPLYVGGRSQ